MAPYCSTDRQMLVHESLNAQDPQHLCEAAQPTPITLGRLSESGQRRWFQKQLCFNPLCPAARTTTQNRPVALTCGNEERLMSQICWASQQAASTMQPRYTGMEDGQSPVGRVMPTVGSRGRQVWLHGLALLPQQWRTETYSRHGKSCRDSPRHERIAEEKTDVWRQKEISTSGSALGAIAACPSLSCGAEQGKGNATGHRVCLFFGVKQLQAVGKSPNFYLQKTSSSAAHSEVLQPRKDKEEEKLMMWCWVSDMGVSQKDLKGKRQSQRDPAVGKKYEHSSGG